MIHFHEAVCAPDELANIEALLKSDRPWDGSVYEQEVLSSLGDIYPNARMMLTPSCTSALELAALTIDIQRGDEVVLPSFTFPSTANAFALRGACLRFAEIDPATFTMGLAEISDAITPRTKAVVAMHYNGVGPDIGAIQELCNQRSIALIEDNAHGLFATANGQPLGSFGKLATLSFHHTKNISCGQGGALIVNDLSLVDKAGVYRDKGTNREAFLQGKVPYYHWERVGINSVPAGLLMASLAAQFQEASNWQNQRQRIWSRYRDTLMPAAAQWGIQLQAVATNVAHAAHAFAFLLPEAIDRAMFLKRLAIAGVQAVPHYHPLHLAPAAGDQPPLPMTERVAKSIVRLPLHPNLTENAAITVSAAVRNALMQAA